MRSACLPGNTHSRAGHSRRRGASRAALLATPLLLLACTAATPAPVDGGGSAAPDLTAPAATPDMAPTSPLIVARPYQTEISDAYDGTQATPLLVLLHGYGADGYTQAAYFGLLRLINLHTILVAHPDGTKDSQGNRFWNATDGCCNFDGSPVDDVAYVSAVIADMRAHYNVDPKRIFVVGHSNGAYMSHRFACDRASTVAAIVALAGDDWLDESRCQPSEGVSVLQVHGDADQSVPYAGDRTSPSAHASVAGWGKKNGCTPAPTDTSAPPLDLDSSLPGAETTLERWTGCKTGAAELWTIHGGVHLPTFRFPAQPELQPNTVWSEVMWSWLMAHPKP